MRRGRTRQLIGFFDLVAWVANISLPEKHKVMAG